MGSITVATIYTYVSQAFGALEQRPLYKSNVANTVTLRQGSPGMDFEVLRKIPVYFPSLDYEFPLDPGYEPTVKPKNKKKEAIFKDLQLMRDGNLLVAVGAEHLYYAAMKSRRCKLTNIGKFYWRLAKMKKFGAVKKLAGADT